MRSDQETVLRQSSSVSVPEHILTGKTKDHAFLIFLIIYQSSPLMTPKIATNLVNNLPYYTNGENKKNMVSIKTIILVRLCSLTNGTDGGDDFLLNNA